MPDHVDVPDEAYEAYRQALRDGRDPLAAALQAAAPAIERKAVEAERERVREAAEDDQFVKALCARLDGDGVEPFQADVLGTQRIIETFLDAALADQEGGS